MNTHARPIAALPMTTGLMPFITDGGLETSLVFHDGIDLPLFVAFPLIESAEGQAALDRYMRRYLDIAWRIGAGFVFETPTWRASHGWGAKLGYGRAAIARINRNAVAMARRLAADYADMTVVVSGNIGPAGDGYAPETMLTAEEARDYHAHQIGAFAEARADLVSAITMTHAGEATGVVLAARDAGIPAVISFTVETDGGLPSGQPLGDAIAEVDRLTDGHAAYFGINCAHPDHFTEVLEEGGDWVRRIRAVRANASRMSHAELDEAEVLDDGDPAELGQDYLRLQRLLPALTVLGGCCGTDHRHVDAMARACLH